MYALRVERKKDIKKAKGIKNNVIVKSIRSSKITRGACTQRNRNDA